MEYLLEKFKGYRKTCSITNLEDGCVTFIRDKKFIKYLINTDKDIWVIAPKTMGGVYSGISKNIRFHFVDNPNYVFTIYHNEINKHLPAHLSSSEIVKGKNCIIHPTAILGVEGFKMAVAPDGKKIQFKNVGNIILEDNVEISALSIVFRASIESTIIKRGVKIGARSNIGHNSITGENTVIAAGVIIGGSTNIGKNCWLGMGTIIRNGISICDNVVMGIGSVIVKDITEPGIYVGSPAKYLKPKTAEFNF